ncbi:hypothetical protein [Streptomyces sp. NBC_01358]|uniref:hypothetical protein n=1 Tax=Streptomyces sp. NBC_01358 TaxID=2903837 RepID=UPI002E344445|nr:hypothetical protein [Streptomyces sp. NBC_01358]
MTIASGVVPGSDEAAPDAPGARYYSMYEQRNRVEEVIGDLDAFRSLIDQTGGLSTPATPISKAR